MAKISIEVHSGTACFVVAVQAPTIQRALDFAETRYPGSAARVKLPSDLAGKFVEDRAA